MYIHAYTNTYRTEMNSENFRHVIENSVPHVHELVLMNDESDLRNWITRNPEDIERQFRHKTPLLIAVKYDVYDCFTVLMDHNAKVEEPSERNRHNRSRSTKPYADGQRPNLQKCNYSESRSNGKNSS
jgi:hypothetical protein